MLNEYSWLLDRKTALSRFAKLQVLDFGKVNISFYTNKNLPPGN